MRSYRRMTMADRCQISAWLQENLACSEIAKRLNFHRTTIYREIRRNGPVRGPYDYATANVRAKKRYKLCRKNYKLRGSLQVFVEKKLRADWSAEQISGRLLIERKTFVSHECIYKYIRAHKSRLRVHLRRLNRKCGAGRHIQRNGSPHQFVPNISCRPDVVARRSRIGDWERDIMFAKNKLPLLVCVERKTRYIRMARVENLKAETVNRMTLKLLGSLKAHTITNDRGTEFKVPLKEIKTYYCDPQAPQQRGSVENTIGLLRQYIKRDTEQNLLTEERIRELERKLNYRPRKVLAFKTPYEVLKSTTVALAN